MEDFLSSHVVDLAGSLVIYSSWSISILLQHCNEVSLDILYATFSAIYTNTLKGLFQDIEITLILLLLTPYTDEIQKHVEQPTASGKFMWI